MAGRSFRRRPARRSRIRGAVVVVLLFIVLIAAAEVFDRLSREHVSGDFRAVDGDTLAQGSERYRIAGIDAPEMDQTCVGDLGRYPCGRLAREHLEKLLAGTGRMECSGSERDRFRRLLVTCVKGSEDIGERMVRDGWAVSFGDYAQAERDARRERIGLWAGDFDRPADWRRAQRQPEEQEHAAGPLTLRLLRAAAARLGWP